MSTRPLAIVFAIIAVAVASTAAAQYAITPDRTVTLVAGDIYFQIEGQEPGDALQVGAGEVITFIVRNVGGMPHNVQFGRDIDQQSRRYGTELHPGFAGVDLDAGGSARITLRMPDEPGTWEIGCLVLGHYEAGQRLALVIE